MQEQSNLIYEQLQQQISQLIEKLVFQDSDEKISQDISVAINNLNILNTQIQKEYDELKRLSEWKRFTIAFYGETNAGKSTLIEALRLLLKEPTKLENQRQFKIQAEKSGLTQDSFDKIRQTIMESEKEITELEDNLQQINQKYAESLMNAEVQIKRLTEFLEDIRDKQSFWQRIISWFIAPKEKKELTIVKQTLSDIQQEKQNETEQSERELKLLLQVKRKAESENERLLTEAEHLKQFADGQIIGDGRSDFTRDNTSFDFNYNGQEFSLIDVPGIEGDENIVRQPIGEAVKKAHAVFYITRTPRPPQTHEGEEGKKGTLEKIKEHLGDQTEVWAIYNHSVNNPRQLKVPLIGNDEREGLQALDSKLKIELGEKYCQSLVVSARPAYLGLTECVIPGSKDANEQRKFLSRFASKQEILNLSGLNDFVEKLSSSIIGDYRNKIKCSNLNKACKVLNKAIFELEELNHQFNSGRKKIRSEVKNAQAQIKVLLEQFDSGLDSSGGKIIRQFESRVGEQIYNDIEYDISNDSFKSRLKSTMESEAKLLENNIRCIIEKESQVFEEEITKIVNRTNKHLRSIVNLQNNTFALNKFDMDIKIDNGIELGSLITSAISLVTGVIALASNPVGWTIAFVGGVLALLGAVIGTVKTVIGIFSSSYKQSQQRKETDKAIRNAKSKIEPELNKILAKIKQGMHEQIQPVITELEMPLKQYESVMQVLKSAEKELQLVSQRIKY
ncbi:hypothetical protein B0186_08185 [Canicola haemoglobinophilus]|uniref:GTP-binding protein Der n=1 Tax=Canicola haemoglobinophilus TaxID=733 RepID=A0A1V4AZZ5_9PAST|nr:hypothetical protein [Canicola haemoglobinophilus]OOR99112.1 hypothetical protein B0186_08185 [Canicola haemoglobinophilus]STO58818.1 GTP-binding protein Der [Canicola haemoglobinophilus]